jgi:peptidoglycan L-alanyl-D-glutamate endopeptidase CwlK
MDITALNEQRLSTVFAALADKAHQMIDQCSAKGVTILITQALRTWAEQDALYAQGRTTPGKIVTQAKGGQSYHNFGLAFDIVPIDAIGKADWDTSHPAWATAEEIGKSLGLEWGGDWTSFKDLPHFQLSGGVTLESLREIYQEGGLASCWIAVTNSMV